MAIQGDQPPGSLPQGDAIITRAHPLTMQRPRRNVRSKTLTDPLWPNYQLTFFLRPLDAVDSHTGLQVSSDLMDKYVHGVAGSGKDKEGNPVQPLVIDGEPIIMTDMLANNIASLAVMQVPMDPSTPPYSVPELIALSVTMPTLWQKLVSFAEEVNGDHEKTIKNGSRGHTGPSFGAPSDSFTNIQDMSSNNSDCGDLSTTDSDGSYVGSEVRLETTSRL